MSYPAAWTVGAPPQSVYNDTQAAAVPFKSAQWTSPSNDVGGGSVTILAGDAATIADGDLLTFKWDGGESRTIVAKRRFNTTITVEGAQRTIVWSGAGHVSELGGYKIVPPLPEGVAPVGDEVRYDWASALLVGWDTATERTVVGDYSSLPPDGLAGLPQGMPNPLAYWIAPRAAVAGPDPVGVWYAGANFTLDAEAQCCLSWIADDLGDVAIDGVIVDQYTNREGMAAEAARWVLITLPAGVHTIRAKIENVERAHPENCSLFAASLASRSFVGMSIIEDWEWTTAIVDGWKTIDYGAGAPGFTWGQIVNQELAQAIAAADDDDPIKDWTVGFTINNDSGSTVWPSVQQRFPVGMSLVEVLRQGVASGEIEFKARPGARVLDMWVAGTRGSTATAIDAADCYDAAYDTDTSAVVARLQTKDALGRYKWHGATDGPHEFVDLGSIDDDAQVDSIAAALLDRMDEETLSVTLTHLPAALADGPHSAYSEGDTVPVPNESGVGTTNMRVVDISTPSTEAGTWPIPVVTFQSERSLLLDRLEADARRQAPGVRSDAVSRGGPGRPTGGTYELWQERFSWNGPANELDTDKLITGPIVVERPMRIHRRTLAVSQGGAGADWTHAEVYLNGSPLLGGWGLLMLAPGVEDAAAYMVYLVQPGDRLDVRLDPAHLGEHHTGTFTLYGAYLPQ